MQNIHSSTILGESHRKDSVMQLHQIVSEAVTQGATDFYTSLSRQEQNVLLHHALESYGFDIEVVLTQADHRIFARILLSNAEFDKELFLRQAREAYINHLGDNLDQLIIEESQRRMGSAA